MLLDGYMRLSFSILWKHRCWSTGLFRHLDLKVDTNVSEKHCVLIFRAEVLKMGVWCFFEALVPTNKPALPYDPVDQHWWILFIGRVSNSCSQLHKNSEHLLLKYVNDQGFTNVVASSLGTARNLRCGYNSHIYQGALFQFFQSVISTSQSFYYINRRLAKGNKHGLKCTWY
jgi:hypothetical protein